MTTIGNRPTTIETVWLPAVLMALSLTEGRRLYEITPVARRLAGFNKGNDDSVKAALNLLAARGLARMEGRPLDTKVRWFLTAKGAATARGARPAGEGT